MNLDTLVRFHNDLVLLDNTKLTIVSYNRESHLVFRQLNTMVIAPYLDNYFFHKKLRFGILTQEGLGNLIKTLELMMQNPKFKSGELAISPSDFSTVVYSLIKGLVGPQIIYKLDYVSFSNPLICKFILSRSGTESKLLLKLLKNERRNRKNQKSIKKFSATEV